MAGGLAQPQASSAAFATMGSQAEIALNSGWIFDQRDNAGSFLTNASPTSSGLTFISTGNATAFYVIGRALKIIQAAGTAVCTVGQSSFAAGITSIYLNQFSTQAGLSTALSTGAITSVAASPLFPGTTGNNTFGGWLTVATTGAAPTLTASSTVLVGGNIVIGSSAITSQAIQGRIRMPAGSGMFVRDVGDTYNEQLIGHDSTASDAIRIATLGGNIQPSYFQLSAVILSAATLTVGSTVSIAGAPAGTIRLGTSPASSGHIRLPNSAIAIVGKTSTGGDDIVWPQQFSSTTLAANVQVSSGTAGTFTNIFSKSLAVGTWHVTAGVTLNSTVAAASYFVQLEDGTNVFASGFGVASGGSTASGVSVVVSQIVSHTTALTYNIRAATSLASSATYALALTPNIVASTGASFWNAVKIG